MLWNDKKETMQQHIDPRCRGRFLLLHWRYITPTESCTDATCSLHRLAGAIVTIKAWPATPGIIDGPWNGIGGFLIVLTMKVLRIATSPRNPENLQKVGLLKKLPPPIRPRPQSRAPLQRQMPPLQWRTAPRRTAHQPPLNQEQRPRLFSSPRQQTLPPRAEEETTEQIVLPFFSCK